MRKFQVTATITMSDEDIRELLEERQIKALDQAAEKLPRPPNLRMEWEIEAAIKGMAAEFNDGMYENRDKGTEANELSIISFKEIT